jgi:rubrerythrin
LSRNRDRMGVDSTPQQAEAPINQMVNNEQPFSFVVPTEFVELPSKGRFYPPGHPLHNQEIIEIKQMTAKEEDILTSRSLLKQGVAIDRVLQSIVIDPRIDVSSLLVGDRNAIVVSCRVSGYGSEYTTSITCPSCEAKNDYTFDLNEAAITNGVLEGVTQNGDGTFNTVLPKSNLSVDFRLLTGRDEKFLTQGQTTKNKNKADRLITSQLRGILVSVNDNDTAEALNYVANNLPSMDSKYLREVYKSVQPNVDLTQHYQCEECGFQKDMEVPLTADFFWPNS